MMAEPLLKNARRPLPDKLDGFASHLGKARFWPISDRRHATRRRHSTV